MCTTLSAENKDGKKTKQSRQTCPVVRCGFARRRTKNKTADEEAATNVKSDPYLPIVRIRLDERGSTAKSECPR